ncbi:MAG: hypothetical protein Kow0042_10890 [Calditrichia bacterium]
MKKTDKPVIVKQSYRPPLEVVWKAITELEEMRQWYFENLPSFKAEPGFKTRFLITHGGRKFTHIWEITEVVPLKRIAYRWRYEEYPGEGMVIFELFKENGVTRLRLTNQVTEDFPGNVPEFTRESCVNGWVYFIQNRLKTYLEKGT